MNEEMAQCARINFENLERAFPTIKRHPYYQIAKAQLDDALGIRTIEESLGPAKEIARVDFNEDGSVKSATGCTVTET